MDRESVNESSWASGSCRTKASTVQQKPRLVWGIMALPAPFVYIKTIRDLVLCPRVPESR